MKFFGKHYIHYLLFAFVVGAVLTIIFKQFAFFNFAVSSVFLWAIASIVERLVDDSRHLYCEFFVAFDWLELGIISFMCLDVFLNALYSLKSSVVSYGMLNLMMVLFALLILLYTVRSSILKSMVHFEWDSKSNLVKSTIDKALKGEVIDTDTASMVSKILVKKFDWSLRTTAKAVGKSHVTVKRYLERKDSKLV